VIRNNQAPFRRRSGHRLPAIESAAGRGRHRLRPALDPFSTLDMPSPGCRPSTEAREVATQMTVLVGDPAPAVSRYLDATSCIPAEHLRYLHARGTRIVMAPSIAVGLDSGIAGERRGRPLTQAEFDQAVRDYDPLRSRVAGLYDPPLDLVFLPTSYSTGDPEWQIVHEIGHALTIARIGSLDADALLSTLPAEIRDHVLQPGYEQREQKVAEVLAETYAWMVVGREEMLNRDLLSALVAMLPGDGDRRTRRIRDRSDHG
jgi:hypothetical protein